MCGKRDILAKSSAGQGYAETGGSWFIPYGLFRMYQAQQTYGNGVK